MNIKTSFRTIKLRWILIYLILCACVERIEFDIPPVELQTVVEGMISDSPGPYTVKVSHGISLDSDTSDRAPIRNVMIKLYDDEGNVEDLVETNPGEYMTGGLIQGKVGHSYYIRLETPDGKIFESEPETINPSGDLDNIRIAYEARTVKKSYGDVAADVFNIYVDSHAASAAESYVRWRFRGTYKVFTSPELHMTEFPPYTPYKNPYPCSGVRVVAGPTGSGGLLLRFADCICCTCWARHYEPFPQLSDTQLASNGQFNNVKVGEVPINNATFHEKYLVEIDQMSLSQEAFDFFRIVREQKESAADLFQPPSGEIRGNIRAINSGDAIVGIFWATSITKKSLFIYPTDIPYPLPPIDFVTLPCNRFYPNASTVQPENWE